ncbi:hypothetical protein [Cohnella sp. REN36]|nr:hypothetical protein [Cohnella sp. REN36]MCC3376048.1 hypothetical protein [Cohnella sp. REN36]
MRARYHLLLLAGIILLFAILIARKGDRLDARNGLGNALSTVKDTQWN